MRKETVHDEAYFCDDTFVWQGVCALHATACLTFAEVWPSINCSKRGCEFRSFTRVSQAAIVGAVPLAHSVQTSKCAGPTGFSVINDYFLEVGSVQVYANIEVRNRSEAACARGIKTNGMGKATTRTTEEESGDTRGINSSVL